MRTSLTFISQLFLLSCVGIPGAPLNWLAAKLPGRPALVPFMMIGQAEQHCIDSTIRDLSEK